jgi:hypothetical protein
MQPRSIVALALLAVLPVCVFAQRGGGGSKAAAPPKPLTAPAPRYPSVRDIEDHNPASLLLDKRKKLSLPDSVVAQLKVLEKTIKDRSAPTLAMYDSVRRRINSSLAQEVSDATPGLQMEDQQNKLGLRNFFGALRDQRKKDAEEALALVPESSKKPAADFLKDQEEDFDRMMPSGQKGRGSAPGER